MNNNFRLKDFQATAACLIALMLGVPVYAQTDFGFCPIKDGSFPLLEHKPERDTVLPFDYTEQSETGGDRCFHRGCLPGQCQGCRALEGIKTRLGLTTSRSDLIDDDIEGSSGILSPTEWRWRIWNRLDRSCKHPMCAYPHLFVPFEVYGRMSVVWLVGGGKLDSHLDPGIGAEIGIRNFLYDDTKPAAWFGELGFEYNYYNGQADEDTPFASIRELNIYWLRVGIGREWYFGGGEPGRWTIVLGAFAGGRFGSANTKFLTEPYRTDNIGGIYAGGHAGFLIPRCGYDIMVEIFTEYGHDWIGWSDILDDTDRHLDHMKLGGAIGLRY